MRKISNTNTCYSRQFTKHTSVEVNALIQRAKAAKIEQFIDEHGFAFCEDCQKSSGVRIDCSHDISVKECKELREVQIAWSVDNITLRCRDCHARHDGLK